MADFIVVDDPWKSQGLTEEQTKLVRDWWDRLQAHLEQRTKHHGGGKMAEITPSILVDESPSEYKIYKAGECLPALESASSRFSEEVLCWRGDWTHWLIGAYDHQERVWHIAHYGRCDCVTHWAFLPPEPQQ